MLPYIHQLSADERIELQDLGLTCLESTRARSKHLQSAIVPIVAGQEGRSEFLET